MRAAAYEIVVFFITIILVAVVYIFLNAGLSSITSTLPQAFPAAYDQTTTTWLGQIWKYWPVFILFGGAFWVLMSVQKRKLEEGEY